MSWSSEQQSIQFPSPSLTRHSLWRVPLSIAQVTFQEVLRDKVLTQVFVLTGLLFLATALAAQISPAMTSRILADFSWGTLLISSLVLAISQGAIALKKEVDRRTLFVVLSRPIYRSQWLLGKFLGLSGVILLNGTLFATLMEALLYLWVDSNSFIAPLSTRVGADMLVIVQSLLLVSIALFFSMMTSASLAIALTFGLYLIGSSHSQIVWLINQNQGAPGGILRDSVFLIPNFELFHLSRYLTYGVPVDGIFLLTRAAYGILWCVLFLTLGGFILRRREF